MKKLIAMLSVFCLLSAGCAVMAEEHVHTWGTWAHVDGTSTHTAACVECGEEKTVKCYSTTATIADKRASICCYCGNYSEGTFTPVEGTAVALNGKDSAQRGTFLVLGKENPFAADPTVVYAFIPGFTKDGGMATFKNKCTVTVKIDAELPENFRLVRVTPQAGDDSNQTPETWTDCEYTWENGVLTFETKSPNMHLIIAE